MEPRNTPNTRKELLYKDETYRIRGAIFEVYGEMGSGFLESVYSICSVVKKYPLSCDILA